MQVKSLNVVMNVASSPCGQKMSDCVFLKRDKIVSDYGCNSDQNI